MTGDSRLPPAVLVVLQSAGLAVLAAVAAQLVGFPGVDLSHSGPFAVLAFWLVAGTVVAVAVAYVAVPALVAVVYARERPGGLVYYQVWALFAIVVLPLLALGSLRLLTWRSPWAILVAAGVGVLVAVVAIHREAADPDTDLAVPWPMFLSVALLVLFVGAFLWVSPMAAAYADEQTASRYGGPPGVSFDVTEAETAEGHRVVTITHDGWKAVDADAVVLEGNGFTDGPGVDQSSPGTWRGETSPGGGWGASETIEPGDSVTVGVENPCFVVVRMADVDHGSLAGYGCEDPA